MNVCKLLKVVLTVDYYVQNFGKKLKRHRRAFYLPNLVLKLPVDESWSLPSRDWCGRIQRDRQKITRYEGGIFTMRTALSSSICTWRLFLPSYSSPALSLVIWTILLLPKDLILSTAPSPFHIIYHFYWIIPTGT